MGLRKLGGQILKSDPPSQSEIIERTALQKEDARKRNRSKSIIGTGIKMDVMKKSNTLPTMPGTLPRKMSLGRNKIFLPNNKPFLYNFNITLFDSEILLN